MSEESAEMPDSVLCWQCASEVPVGPHCIICGHGLSDELAARKDAAGRYRANPDESARAVSVMSTLFPQLPRADLDVFRIALAIGTAVVVGLTILEFYPLAIVVGAAIVPLLVCVYVYEVDIYEDEPVLILGATLAWGAVTGALVAFLARSISLGPPSRSESDLFGALALAAGLEIVQLLVILGGPLVLLRYGRFNDVLDGVTYGVASAAGFVCTYTIVTAVDVLGSGLTPGGDVTSWLFSIVNLALLRPLLLTSVGGAVCAALWIRYRAPARDRWAMGALAIPAVALAFGAFLLAAAAVTAAIAPTIPAIAVRAGLAAVALVWLRQAIHLGLRQEAAELPIGPPRPCPNCGRMTPWHSFCASCGVSLRALPRHGRPPTPAPEREHG